MVWRLYFAFLPYPLALEGHYLVGQAEGMEIFWVPGTPEYMVVVRITKMSDSLTRPADLRKRYETRTV